MRTPETLTAAERAERLRAQANATAEKNAEGTSPVQKKSPQELARASLMSGMNLDTPSASAELNPRLDVDGAFSILRIEDIVAYKNNPRRTRNPKYEDIKESIRADTITNTLTVTRRPGEERYFPYGGGNTRLQIAKELHAEGDQRFAKLRVVIKAWTHESDVLAAHMAENVNRGDTTFWDNAQGVAAFKREWEEENPGRTVIGAELNQQLRLAGVNYGIRMIQNFLFAVDHLEPVGPWLRTESLNVSIRPALGSYIELAIKLDRQRPATAQLREAMERYAQDLQRLEQRNLERDPDERSPVELDPDDLIADAAAAIAQGLDMPLKRIQALAQALQERPRLNAKELLALDLQAPIPAQAKSPRSPAPSVQPQGAASPANDPVGQAARDGADSGPGATPTQVPLGAMVGVVGGSVEPQRSHDASGASLEEPGVDIAQKLRDQVIGLVAVLDQLVPIADCILDAPSMPFGYLVDLPEHAIHLVGADDELPEDIAGLREALWWLLAMLSGQTQGPMYLAVRQEPVVADSRWATALALGPKFMTEELNRTLGKTLAVYGAITTPTGAIAYEVFLSSLGMWSLMTHPALGPKLSQFIGLINRMRDCAAEDFAGSGHIELPEWDESMLR